MKLVAATGNQNKIRELTTVAKEFGVEIIDPLRLSESLGSLPPVVEEVGQSYLENAWLKASAYSTWSGLDALGDDSGLEVVALGGAPGLHSSRYAGPGSSDHQKIAKLLFELEAKEATDVTLGRQAFFRCALATVSPDGSRRYCAESKLHGEILRQTRGQAGFGYDQIVFIPEIGATLAELSFQDVCAKGFRGLALRKLLAQMVGAYDA